MPMPVFSPPQKACPFRQAKVLKLDDSAKSGQMNALQNKEMDERPDTWVTVCTGHMGDTLSL